MRTRKALCENCCRLTEIEAVLCKTCKKDNSDVKVLTRKLLQMRPELRGMTPPQVFLQLAKAYLMRD